MSLASYRAELGLTLEQVAVALGLKPSSRGWISEIENGRKDASLRLALRIERWSGGRVTAASVCREMAEHQASPVDAAIVSAPEPEGAGKIVANIPRTDAPA